jgi:ATP-dependent Clp protease adaptor protein ClpS
MERQKAVELMMEIHQNGKGIAGTYIKSIAEAKIILVREVAVKSNYPLNVTLEKC